MNVCVCVYVLNTDLLDNCYTILIIVHTYTNITHYIIALLSYDRI